MTDTSRVSMTGNAPGDGAAPRPHCDAAWIANRTVLVGMITLGNRVAIGTRAVHAGPA